MIIAPPEYAIGTVYRQDPVTGTCDVLLIDDHGNLPNVPVLGTASSDLSNDVETPVGSLNQAKVLLIKLCSKWYILTTIPTENSGPSGTSVSVTNTETGGDNPITYKRMDGESEDNGSQKGVSAVKKYTGGRSVDTMSGDKHIAADGGADLLLGKEGLVVIKASTLAQIILGAYKDFARIVAREFELFTDFGTVRFTGGGKEGVTGMAIMGGGNLADEASTVEPAYPVHIFIGEVPWDVNGRYAMRVSSPDGSQYIGAESDIMGNLETHASNIMAERSKMRSVVTDADSEEYVAGGKVVRVGSNDLPGDTEADLRERLFGFEAGSRVTSIENNETLQVENGDYVISVDTGNQTVSVKGNQDTVVNGAQTTNVTKKITESTSATKDLNVAGLLKLAIGGLSIGSYSGGTGTLQVTTSNSLNITKA